MSALLQKALYNAQFTTSYATSAARSAGFLAENLGLGLIESLFQNQSRMKDPEFKSRLGLILKELNLLLQKDAAQCADGVFPAKSFVEENPLDYGISILSVFWDAFRVAQRRKSKNHSDLPELDEAEMAYYPEYYRRNFHYQTDGYLSAHSAKIYDHQVEVLFSGAGGPMRRAMLAPLKERLRTEDGAGLHLLEVGAGTGSLTRYLKLALPKARITALDLSQPYLHLSQKRLKDFPGLEFIQSDAADLPFKEGIFDGFVSCFLFHELPLNVRSHVIKEAHRVLKPHGVFAMTDALQKNESELLSWALEKFPQDFHEPFFKNYTQNPIENLLKDQRFVSVDTQFAFLSKVVVAQRA